MIKVYYDLEFEKRCVFISIKGHTINQNSLKKNNFRQKLLKFIAKCINIKIQFVPKKGNLLCAGISTLVFSFIKIVETKNIKDAEIVLEEGFFSFKLNNLNTKEFNIIKDLVGNLIIGLKLLKDDNPEIIKIESN